MLGVNATPVPPTTVNVDCDFGVAQIIYNSRGNYTVNLNLVKPDGTPMSIDCGSATATLLATSSEDFSCGIINTSPVSGTSFNVYIRQLDCINTVDLPFTFKVTGRPQ